MTRPVQAPGACGKIIGMRIWPRLLLAAMAAASAHAVAAPLPPMAGCAFAGSFAGAETYRREPVGRMVTAEIETRLLFRIDSVETVRPSPYGPCPNPAAGATLSFRDFRPLADAVAALTRQGVAPGVRVTGTFTTRGDEHWTAYVIEALAVAER